MRVGFRVVRCPFFRGSPHKPSSVIVFVSDKKRRLFSYAVNVFRSVVALAIAPLQVSSYATLATQSCSFRLFSRLKAPLIDSFTDQLMTVISGAFFLLY